MRDLMRPEPLLEVRNLRISITAKPEIALVEDVSFELAPGESLGIVGESGSGKSLTAMAIAGLLAEDLTVSGSVKLDGVELVGLDEASFRTIRGAKIGMIFQDPNESLNPVFPIAKQLGFAIRAHAPQLTRKQVRARVLELLEMVAIPRPVERLRQYPFELSGGLRQRVMIAIALASSPKLLIADEPTTSLDVSVQAEILELLDTLARETGLATMLITHDLGVVAGQCSRIMAMYSGQVVESGSTADFTSSPAHPYARALLDCIPELSALGTIRPGIPGNPLSPEDYGEGCRFQGRCAFATEKCGTTQTLVSIGVGPSDPRKVRCWRASEEQFREMVTTTGEK